MTYFNSAQPESFFSLLFKHPIALFLTLTLHTGLIAVMVLNVATGERIKPAPKTSDSDSRIAKVQKAENEIIQTTVVDEALVQKFIGDIEKRKLKEQKEQDRRLKKIAQAEQNLKKSKAQTAKQKKQAELAVKRANEKAKKAKQELAASEKKKKNLLEEQQAIQKKAKLAEEKREKAVKERERLAKLTQEEQKRLKEIQLEKQLQQENAKKQQLQAAAENAKLEQIQQSKLAEIKRLYIASIEQTVRKNWRKPNKYDNAWSCEVLVEQNAQGEVGDVKTENCTGDEKFINSVERAVFRSDPLPLPKDRRIFENRIRFRFSP